MTTDVIERTIIPAQPGAKIVRPVLEYNRDRTAKTTVVGSYYMPVVAWYVYVMAFPEDEAGEEHEFCYCDPVAADDGAPSDGSDYAVQYDDAPGTFWVSDHGAPPTIGEKELIAKFQMMRNIALKKYGITDAEKIQ